MLPAPHEKYSVAGDLKREEASVAILFPVTCSMYWLFPFIRGVSNKIAACGTSSKITNLCHVLAAKLKIYCLQALKIFFTDKSFPF